MTSSTAATRPAERSAAPGSEKERASRVLIVEDVAGQRRTLSAILEKEGFLPMTAGSGEEALVLARGHEIQVAILDYRLPDLTGIEILERLRAIDSRIQAILHTAYGSFDSARDAVNLGAFGYLEKPSDPAELVRTVHRANRQWMALALARSEEQRRLLGVALEQAHLPIAVTTAETQPGPRYAYVNPAFSSLTGYSEDELVGKSPDMLYGFKTQRSAVERLREQRDGGRPAIAEMYHYRKDGSAFLMEVRVDPVRDDDGRITHWVMIYR